jgi:hypothetical protein
MPYDTICWGEAQACNGLTGVAALSGQNHGASGDKLTLKSTPEPPFLQGLGGLSDTKPQQVALVPDELQAQNPILGPAGMNFWSDGWLKELRQIPIELIKGDALTGQLSNTNVNEGAIVGADVTYGRPVAPWTLEGVQGRYSKVFTDTITITSAAAVTFNSGSGALSGKASNYAKWSDSKGEFEILGIIHGISAATYGGICNVTKLGGEWDGKQPGLIVSPLSAVTFDAGGSFAPALEPIPFEGDSVPDVGMTATSAGAVTFSMLIGKL